MNTPVDDDPALAASIGRATAHWSLVELQVQTMFWHLLDTPLQVAVAVFSFFKTVRTQRDVLVRLAKIAFKDHPAGVEAVRTTMKSYVALSERRNALIHAPFGLDGKENPPSLYKMLRATEGEFPYRTEPISTPAIDALTDEIKSLGKDFNMLEYWTLKTLRPSLLATLPKPPSDQGPEGTRR